MTDAPSVPRAHPAGARRRAWHVWLLSKRRSRAVRSTARLTLLATYSIVFMWGGFFDWSSSTETVLWGLGALLWVAILALYVREVRRAARRREYLTHHLSLPLFLAAPVFLWLTWFPLGSFITVVVAYVLELRHHSSGDGFLFSFGLVAFVGVFAGLSMVEVENDNPQSSLKSPADPLFWSFASLLKINYGKALSPETHDGRILATVVGACAILGASLFTAQIVSWVVGAQKDKEDQERAEALAGGAGGEDAEADVRAQLAAIRAELAAIRAALAPALAGGAGQDRRRVQ